MNAQMMADIIAGASTDADMENLMRNILQMGPQYRVQRTSALANKLWQYCNKVA